MAMTVLAANGAARLRRMAGAFFLVSLAADAIGAGNTSLPLLAVAACAGTVAAAILFIAAGDDTYGEEPGWRLWMATLVAAGVTAAAFASFRSATATEAATPLLGGDTSGLTLQVGAFWLLSSGIAILLSARSAVRSTLGALLMTGGVQLLLRLTDGPHLALSLLIAWLQVVVALAGAYLIVNERVTRDQ
ncbi:MAG: hypothetical protein EXR61_03120 [Chloroflexi bacterium]|nr:hypothetical protein [Chloroflexota bacterium]